MYVALCKSFREYACNANYEVVLAVGEGTISDAAALGGQLPSLPLHVLRCGPLEHSASRPLSVSRHYWVAARSH